MTMLERSIPVRGPFRFDLALRYYASSPSTIAEVVDEASYRRAFAGPSGPAVAVVRAGGRGRALALRVADGGSADSGAGVVVAVEGPGASEAALEQAVVLGTRAFGLADDPSGLGELAEADPILGAYVRRYLGLRPLAIPDPFEALVWAILGQQINISFAAKLKRVLLERYGRVVEHDGQVYRLFPAPDRLVDVTPEELRPLRFSRQKSLYVRELARALASGELDLEALRAEPDEAVVAELTRIKGIGRWTAEYLLLRGFGRRDAIPAGDMGLRIFLGRVLGLGRNATELEVREWAAPFAPYRGYLAMTMWFALQQRDF
jgi:DNA-3-methyladenine glycosylase II